MSEANQKTVWKKLDVSMPSERKAAIVSACQLLGIRPCAWARNELEVPYLRLCAAAEQKRRELQALITPEDSGGRRGQKPRPIKEAWQRKRSARGAKSQRGKSR